MQGRGGKACQDMLNHGLHVKWSILFVLWFYLGDNLLVTPTCMFTLLCDVIGISFFYPINTDVTYQLTILTMAASKWTKIFSRLKHIGVFLVSRYPFINAGLLMMVLGERADVDKNVPPFSVELLYPFIVVMVLLGVGMSYELRRLECTMVFVAQITYMAYSLYANERLSYNPWLKNRLISRCIGLAGVYIIYAYLTSVSKNKQLRKIGEGCLAVFTMSSMYILVNSTEDRDFFVQRIPLQTMSLFFLVTVMGACAMIYINGDIFVTDASQAMMCINLALLVTINGDMAHWVKRRGVPYWVQVKIICDDVNICIGLFVMAFANVYWSHRLPKEDKRGNLYRHDESTDSEYQQKTE